MTSKARLMRSFVERAMRGAETLPPTELADLNEAAAIALRPFDARQAQVAQQTAGLLRQAAEHQLTFLALLRS